LRNDPPVFRRTVVVLVLVYVGVRFGTPWLGVLVGASQTPAPVPAFARGMYMACALLGAFVYLSSDDERWKHFLAPIVGVFVFRPGAAQRHQLAVLAILPLLAGWVAWRGVVPRPQTRAAIRLPHPAMPGTYTELVNPFRGLPDEQRRVVEREGTVLYQKNCRPCHGTTAAGNGPLARGLRLQPVDFTDPGTIATLVEPYALWRVHAGGLGLPPIATPWNSAMPSWRDELGDDEIWKIIMAAYRIAGTEPRLPEGAER
jgi:mono/diheme cytochrome c family protein